MNIVVEDLHGMKETMGRKKQQVLGLIEVADRNLRVTERYLGIYGKRMSPERLYALGKHLREQRRAFEEMCRYYCSLDSGQSLV